MEGTYTPKSPGSERPLYPGNVDTAIYDKSGLMTTCEGANTLYFKDEDGNIYPILPSHGFKDSAFCKFPTCKTMEEALADGSLFEFELRNMPLLHNHNFLLGAIIPFLANGMDIEYDLTPIQEVLRSPETWKLREIWQLIGPPGTAKTQIVSRLALIPGVVTLNLDPIYPDDLDILSGVLAMAIGERNYGHHEATRLIMDILGTDFNWQKAKELGYRSVQGIRRPDVCDEGEPEYLSSSYYKARMALKEIFRPGFLSDHVTQIINYYGYYLYDLIIRINECIVRTGECPHLLIINGTGHGRVPSEINVPDSEKIMRPLHGVDLAFLAQSCRVFWIWKDIGADYVRRLVEIQDLHSDVTSLHSDEALTKLLWEFNCSLTNGRATTTDYYELLRRKK